jgi:hypothetical protein
MCAYVPFVAMRWTFWMPLWIVSAPYVDVHFIKCFESIRLESHQVNWTSLQQLEYCDKCTVILLSKRHFQLNWLGLHIQFMKMICSFVHCAQLTNFWDTSHIVNVNHQNWVCFFAPCLSVWSKENVCASSGEWLAKKAWFQWRSASLGTVTMGLFCQTAKKKGNLTTSYSLSWPHPIIPPWQNWRDDLDMFLLGPSNVPKATCNSYVHSLADNSLLPTGNAHVSEKYAGQNARSWMTDSCLQNVMTKNTSCAQCTTVATSKELIISSLCQSTTDNCYLCSIVIVCTAVKSIRVAIQSLSKRRESLFVSFTSHVCLGHIWFHSFLCQSSPSSNYYWQKKAKLVSLKEGNKQHLLVVIRTGSVTAWKLSQNQYKIHVESNWDFLKNSI